MKYLCNYTDLYAEYRLTIKNNHRGHSYLGCVIFFRDKIYSYGINQYNVDFKFNSIHAEVDAVSKLKYSEKIKKVNLLVFRINKNKKELCNAKPCQNCIHCIKYFMKKKNYRLKANKCWYTNENGEFTYLKI